MKNNFDNLFSNESLKQYFKELSEKNHEESKKIKALISNWYYMEWLDQFTCKHPYFTNDLYEEICENDRDKVKQLELLFKGIEIYACRNYVYPIENRSREYYSINYKNKNYNIGTVFGQGIYFYCEVADEIVNSIDFNDIMFNKKQPNVDLIKNNLEKINEAINILMELGIPKKAIKDNFDTTLNQGKLEVMVANPTNRAVVISKEEAQQIMDKNKSKKLTKK